MNFADISRFFFTASLCTTTRHCGIRAIKHPVKSCYSFQSALWSRISCFLRKGHGLKPGGGACTTGEMMKLWWFTSLIPLRRLFSYNGCFEVFYSTYTTAISELLSFPFKLKNASYPLVATSVKQVTSCSCWCHQSFLHQPRDSMLNLIQIHRVWCGFLQSISFVQNLGHLLILNDDTVEKI